MTTPAQPDTPRGRDEPPRAVVGAYFGVLIVLVVSLVGLSLRPEPLPMPEAGTLPSAAATLDEPSGGEAPSAWPAPAGDADPEPPPSF